MSRYEPQTLQKDEDGRAIYDRLTWDEFVSYTRHYGEFTFAILATQHFPDVTEAEEDEEREAAKERYNERARTNLANAAIWTADPTKCNYCGTTLTGYYGRYCTTCHGEPNTEDDGDETGDENEADEE